MDQRSGGLPRGQLWRITVPNGSLSACVRPAATTEIWARPVGSHCRLRQPSRTRLCDREHQGRPGRAGAGVPNVSGWAKFAVLKMVSKVVESLPENGIPQPVSSRDAVSYRKIDG